jgi:nitrogen fixation protein NifM
MPALSELNPYVTLKLAHELFKKPPCRLEPEEREHLDQVAARQLIIEKRILATLEAAQVILPASRLEQALAEIRGRYESETEYLADLERSGIDPAVLVAAIERDLKVAAVLDRIGAQAAEVTPTDVEIFYLVHRERFRHPANRTLKHILVTINDSLPGNDRTAARQKIEAIRARLIKSPDRFAEQALKHSECPSAMNGGLLGTLASGELYAELETVAFNLALGELSEVVESPLGFHIIHCVAIETASEHPLSAVREKIRTHLDDSRRRALQKAWIKSLFKKETA